MRKTTSKILLMASIVILVLNAFLISIKIGESQINMELKSRTNALLEPNQILTLQSNESFLLEQEGRAAHAKEVCEKRKTKRSLPTFSSRSRFIYDPKSEIGYCPIYKSASTSITDTLTKIKGVNAPSLFTLKDLRKYFTVDSITRSISKRYEDVTKFIAVRNPLERLLSAYRDKLELAKQPWYYNQYGKNIVRQYRFVSPLISPKDRLRMLNEVTNAMKLGRNVSALVDNVYTNPVGPTFQEFVKYVSKDPSSDVHWMPFYIQCGMCLMTYDFILKFESLGSEMEYLLHHLNQSHVKMPWNSANPEGRTNAVLCKYLATITRKDFDKLVQVYAYDFLLFGYDYEPYVKCVEGLSWPDRN